MYQTQWSELPDEEKKIGLVRNFEYRTTLHYYEDKPVLSSPNGDELTINEIWQWLEYNGLSLENSYQDNMNIYLSKYGFIRKRIYGKTIIINQYGEQITQKEALKFIDKKRKLTKNENIEQQIHTNISQNTNGIENKQKTTSQAIQEWANERRHNQSFQDWLMEKAGYN